MFKKRYGGFSSLELPPAARKGGKQGTEGGDTKF